VEQIALAMVVGVIIRIQVVPTVLIVIVHPVSQVVAPQIQLIKTLLVAVPGIQVYVEVELVMMTRGTRLKHVMYHHVLDMGILGANILPPVVSVVPVLQLVPLMVFLIVALVLDVQMR
jgi:3-polyprenyl-4-hydroxybenzoate decarboxylase